MENKIKIWCENENERKCVTSYLENHGYEFYDDKSGEYHEENLFYLMGKPPIGIFINTKNKDVEESYFSVYENFVANDLDFHEITFEEFKKLYLEENKMKERKVSNNYDTMPKLETGMFVENMYGKIGIVAKDRIVYQNGGFDIIWYILNENGWIVTVYDGKGCGFESVKGTIPIWKFKPCIEISKKEIIEKFDLINSEYCQIVVSELPPKNDMPNFKNGLFVHSISEGWGVVVDERVIFRYIYGHAGAFMPDDIDAINENAECFEDCKREPTWNVINWIPESKFRKQFNIPENYDFKIVD